MAESRDFGIGKSSGIPGFGIPGLQSLITLISTSLNRPKLKGSYFILISSGPDGLPNWMLKDFAPIISEPLAVIFNSSLREGYFPEIWKTVEVVPVPKVNPPSPYIMISGLYLSCQYSLRSLSPSSVNYF